MAAAALPFDPTDPAFIADPYPQLAALREAGAVHYDERLRRYLVTRHADVRACLRDRRLGRNFRHVGGEDEFNAEPLDPRWESFWDVERWSLLFIEPPDHTRIRKLVASAFTPRAVEALREPAERLAPELLDTCLERGRFDRVDRRRAAERGTRGDGEHARQRRPRAPPTSGPMAARRDR